MYPRKPTFEIKAEGQASVEAQLNYTKQLLHIASDRIASLEMDKETQRLEYTLWKNQLEQDLAAMTRIYQEAARNKMVPPIKKKKRWWCW